MKKLIKFLVPIFIFLILLAPALSLAQGLIPCNNNSKDIEVTNEAGTKTTIKAVKCDFNMFMRLINRVIDFALVKMAIPIAAIMFAYAGVTMLVGGGESGSARTKAKGIFTNTLIGLVLAAASWIIVKTLLTILGYEGAWIGF
ncbi:MAG: hypothetical protein WD991_02515 [Candidatus Paceibacterota bacterium]